MNETVQVKFVYRIYLDEVTVGDGTIFPGGWYGWRAGIICNDYLYCRLSEKENAYLYDTQDDVMSVIRDMRMRGYPAHADPSFTYTEQF